MEGGNKDIFWLKLSPNSIEVRLEGRKLTGWLKLQPSLRERRVEGSESIGWLKQPPKVRWVRKEEVNQLVDWNNDQNEDKW